MTQHPIEGLMKVAMENIKEMVDVNTIVGDPVETPDGSVIMPISKVGFGFAAGGSEFVTDSEIEIEGAVLTKSDALNAKVALPFGGGSGGGVSITPIAFLVVGSQGVKVVPLDNNTHILERLIDSAPQVVDKIQSMMGMKAGMTGMGATSSSMPGMTSTSPSGTTSSSTMGTAGTTSTTTSTGSTPASSTTNQNFIV